jgi:hypothetical protein
LKQKINLIGAVPLIFVPEAVAKKRIKIGLKLPFLMVFTGILSDSHFLPLNTCQMGWE